MHDFIAELAAGLKQVFFVRWQISMPLCIVLIEILRLHIFTTDETIDSIKNLFRLMLAFEMSLKGSWIKMLAAYFALWLDFVDIKHMSLLLILEYCPGSLSANQVSRKSLELLPTLIGGTAH